MEGYSKACCTIPPVLPADKYQVKGKYEVIDGVQTYVTGPSDATLGVLFIYDIFGFFPQTLQGADILSTSDKHHQYQVFMPAFFGDTPCKPEWYPPTTEEQGKLLGEWMAANLNPPAAVARLPGMVKSYEAVNPNIKKWAIIGFCWGGKAVSLASAAGTVFTVGAQSSPAMISAADAAKVVIPQCFLPSNEENVDDVKAYDAALTVDHYTETFDEVHGWMSARASLDVGTKSEKEYERGYETVLNFFAKYMTVKEARI